MAEQEEAEKEGGAEVAAQERAWSHGPRATDDAATEREAQSLLDLLTETSVALSTTLDVNEAVRRLSRLVLPRLADWCIVSALDPATGQLHDLAVTHRDPACQQAADRYAAGRIPALRSDSPTLRALTSLRLATAGDGDKASIDQLTAALMVTPESRRQLTELAPGSVAAVPLVSGGRAIGLLHLYRDAGHHPWTEQELRASTDLAARAGTALENARLFTDQRRLIEALQRSLLTDPPELDRASIEVRYVPAVEAAVVGGDWYDAFLQRGDAPMIVIGDVVGHDVSAATAMGQLRSLLRGIAAYSGAGPAEVLAGLDRSMSTLRLPALATAAVATLDHHPDAGEHCLIRMTWSSAGHPPPLVVDDAGQVAVLGDWHGDLMLGVDPSATRREHVMALAGGSTVLFYTDGLIERRDSSLDEGLASLCTTVREVAHLPLAAFCDALVRRHIDGRPQDDVALVAIRLRS